MDLVAGVRKEGSRGGRAEFKWEDVKGDQHRENYLGHSLMAPVGRWQKNRDLSWYAKGDDSEAAKSAADARKEEIKRIKEAEQDALSEALGYPVMPKPRPMEKAEAGDIERAIKETADEEDEVAKGVGFGGVTSLPSMRPEANGEMMPGRKDQRGGLDGAARPLPPKDRRKRDGSRDRDRDKRRRSRSRDHDRRHRHRRDDDERRPSRKHRSLSRRRDRDDRRRSRSRSLGRRRDSERYDKPRRDRSYSPQRRDRSRERLQDRDYDRRR